MGRILLVDDHEDIRTIVGELLRDEGYVVEEAENGRDALDKLATNPKEPCLILLDTMMPEMTGTQMLANLAHHHRLAALPVIVLSANIVTKADAEGARRVVRKPVSSATLLALVKEFCDA